MPSSSVFLPLVPLFDTLSSGVLLNQRGKELFAAEADCKIKQKTKSHNLFCMDSAQCSAGGQSGSDRNG